MTRLHLAGSCGSAGDQDKEDAGKEMCEYGAETFQRQGDGSAEGRESKRSQLEENCRNDVTGGEELLEQC